MRSPREENAAPPLVPGNVEASDGTRASGGGRQASAPWRGMRCASLEYRDRARRDASGLLFAVLTDGAAGPHSSSVSGLWQVSRRESAVPTVMDVPDGKSARRCVNVLLQ